MTEHISCDCKCKFNSTTCNSQQKWNNNTSQCEFKNYHKFEKDYSLNPSICICGKGKYLESTANTSVTKCDKIVIVMKNLLIKKTNAITTNITTAALTNFHSKNVRDCYLLHALLLVFILLLTTVSICCYLIKISSRALFTISHIINKFMLTV